MLEKTKITITKNEFEMCLSKLKVQIEENNESNKQNDLEDSELNKKRKKNNDFTFHRKARTFSKNVGSSIVLAFQSQPHTALRK